MAKVDVPVTIKVVVGDAFASQSPRMRELAAKRAVERAMQERAEEALSCTDWQDEPTQPSGKAYPTSSAEMQARIGMGSWTAGWMCDDAGEPIKVFGELLTAAPIHITYNGAHCGKEDCTMCDPLDRMVDGLTVRECLERYEQRQRKADQDASGNKGWCYRFGYELWPLTPAQKQAAQTGWSLELKRKQQEAREKERCVVCVDDDRWEP